MALINTQIPPASFEIVRDRIAAILAEEITNQNTLFPDPELSLKVWLERIVPFNRGESPAINVRWAGTPYNSRTMVQSDGVNTYQIDCYAQAKTSTTEPGDAKAILKVQKLLRVCRAILMNPKYKTLGYLPGFVMTTNISNMKMGEEPDQDAMNYLMGSLLFDVKLPETTELINPPLIQGAETTLTIEETEQGYFYEIN